MDLAQVLQRFLTSIEAFVQNTILEPQAWIQIALIIIALLIGWGVRKIARPRLIPLIDRSGLNFRIRGALKNITYLILHVIAALILLIGLKIHQAGGLGIDIVLARAAVSLILAWITIRVAAQFIQNTFIRQAISLVAWIIAALTILGIRSETAVALDSLGVTIGELRLSALTVTKGAIALFILLYLAIFVSALLERRLNKVSGLTISSRVLLAKITRVVLVTLALLVGITMAGIDLSLLAVFGGALGLGLGFGLQKGTSNLFSGMLLLMDRSIKPNDIIELPSTTGGRAFGWVQHMGARYTEIITRDNKSFLIPNEDFITQQVINWSHGNTLIRLESAFGVSYDCDPHEVKKLAEEAASVPSRVVDDPAPVCHLVEFGDSSLNFVIRYWISDAHKGVTNMRGAVMLALWDSFKENNIPIPYPHREVYLHTPDNSPDNKPENGQNNDA